MWEELIQVHTSLTRKIVAKTWSDDNDAVLNIVSLDPQAERILKYKEEEESPSSSSSSFFFVILLFLWSPFISTFLKIFFLLFLHSSLLDFVPKLLLSNISITLLCRLIIHY